jgi:Ran GTPase-activating protein (RanGAP) involved in mRNA processing and transport
LAREIANSSSLKLVELKFNSLTTKSVRRLIEELKRVGNKTLLFVDLSGNKIDKVTFDELEEILKSNRKLNPISR